MTSLEDAIYINYLASIRNKSNLYFSYSLPWMSIGWSTFALFSLYIRRRVEKNLLLFLFKCRYWLCLAYALNMVLQDPNFTSVLFGYNTNFNIIDAFCKMRTSLQMFIYCIPPWMHVVINLILNFVFIKHVHYIL